MKPTAPLVLILSIVALSGCGTMPKSPREAFLSRTSDRTNYFRLYEVSLESLRAEEERILRLTRNFTKGVREVSTNCPACPTLQERLSRMESVADSLHKPHVEFMEQLQKVYDPKTDSILFFHYWVGDTQEAGYLVTRNGAVKKRFGFGEKQHD